MTFATSQPARIHEVPGFRSWPRAPIARGAPFPVARTCVAAGQVLSDQNGRTHAICLSKGFRAAAQKWISKRSEGLMVRNGPAHFDHDSRPA
jgi:hypothetical protein